MIATQGTARAAADFHRPGSHLRAALMGAAILAGFAGGAWAESHRTVLLRAEGLEPLASLATELGRRHGLAVTYEDLPKPEPGDVGEAYLHHRRELTPDGRHAVEEPPPLVLHYDVGEESGLVKDPAALLAEAVAVHNQGQPRGTFRLERHGDTYHLVPAAVRATDGRLRPAHSLLDVAIDLPVADRTVQATLDAILEAVGRARGVRIRELHWGGPIQAPCRLGFSQVPAHEALERVLELFTGGRWVWHLLAPAGPEWQEEYQVRPERAEPNLGDPDRVFEPPSDPWEWESIGPGDKPWRRLSMEQAAALVASPAEGYRIAGYNAIVEAHRGRRMTAEERAAVIAALLPLAAAGDSESWYSTRVLASLALGQLQAAEAVPVLLRHLRDDFPRPNHYRGFSLPPAAIALTLIGSAAVDPIVARAATADKDERRLLLLTLRFMVLSPGGPGPTVARAAADRLSHLRGGEGAAAPTRAGAGGTLAQPLSARRMDGASFRTARLLERRASDRHPHAVKPPEAEAREQLVAGELHLAQDRDREPLPELEARGGVGAPVNAGEVAAHDDVPGQFV
jgi:hypothetical protein